MSNCRLGDFVLGCVLPASNKLLPVSLNRNGLDLNAWSGTVPVGNGANTRNDDNTLGRDTRDAARMKFSGETRTIRPHHRSRKAVATAESVTS